jgi:hypothetical protein
MVDENRVALSNAQASADTQPTPALLQATRDLPFGARRTHLSV